MSRESTNYTFLKNCIGSALLVAGLTLGVTTLATAEEDLGAMADKVKQYAVKGDYQKALDELGWLRNELEKRKGEGILALFPAELNGYKAGKPEANSAMGFSTVECEYTKGENSVQVSLMSGGQGALGGLAALGQMAAMYGGQNALRINGRTAMMENNEITLTLDGGAMLKFAPNLGETPMSAIRAIAEAFPADKVEQYLKGK